jgi:tetratricopeptide (TPR) repeat protein
MSATVRGVRVFRAVRWWHPLVSVVVAALVGVVTNLATGEGSSWWLKAALVALVVVQVALVVWQAGQDQRAKRDARDRLLGPLRPSLPAMDPVVPDGQAAGGRGIDARAVVHWLTAPFSPTPLWGRSDVHTRLLAWCTERDPQAGVVRVVTGPAGVGKSRLALAVAESLPTGWAAGRLQDGGVGLVERIVDAEDPTLVVVDDAARVPHLDSLITQATRYPDLIRLLLLTRTDASLRTLPDTVLPQLIHVGPLALLGEAGDRQRWYVEAVRAYARALRVSPPDLPDRPVGTDEDTPLVLHARALLAVLGRTGTRTWSLAEIVTELVTLEQRTWQPDLTQLPDGCDLDVLAEAITVLSLLPATTPIDAAELLRRVPQFAHDTAHQSRVAVARWARRRYPLGPDHRLDLRPYLIAERLLLDTLTRTPQLLHDDDGPIAAPVLARAYTTYSDALDHLNRLRGLRRSLLPQALAAVLSTGATGPNLDRLLATLINTEDIANDDGTRARLVALVPPDTMPYLRVAHGHLVVTHYRAMAASDPQQNRHDLAAALHKLSVSLHELARYREALPIWEEAVATWRELAEAEAARYRPGLAIALSNLGAGLRELGRRQEALAAWEEAVAILRELAEAEPDRYRPGLATALSNLGAGLQELGRCQEALAVWEEAVAIHRELAEAAPDQTRPDLALVLTNLALGLHELARYREALPIWEEAVATWRELAEAEADRYRPGLATALSNFGAGLQELGRHRQALAIWEEAVAIHRELAAAEPHRTRPHLANTLSDLGTGLRALGRHREALVVWDEVVVIRRELVKAEPDRYRPGLATALSNLGFSLQEIGCYREALAVDDEAVAIFRELAAAEPNRHRHRLATALGNFGISLQKVGRHQEALAAWEEAVATWRELAEAEPDQYRPDLITALTNLGLGYEETGELEESVRVQREAVAMWRACAEHDPQLYGASYQQALTTLHKQLTQIGRYQEAIALDLTT